MKTDLQLTHKFKINGMDIFVPIAPSEEQKLQNTVDYGKEYGVSQLLWSTKEGNTNVILSDDVYTVNMTTGEATFIPYEIRFI